ncbi:arsenic resistance N-acetyltransferase ArsN2 [Sphingomonas donggukensis]|uniref:Arsenic resistance N-acetyltransferase ArsN2 n=1 Tax=Sphingomonas donggukensis TaxID=2949093 RepID=A0ABY4TVK9_9SPHN|nr:arsenic resistance N-acetyltransferase ArsN2 [Sphingomonas donggukensis]URW75910.1 arsenic resistance N-acetyltransferase ArsN2 [Sphingomonas donggukensis]
MIATAIDASSLADLATELEAAGLVVSDLADPDRRFFRFEDAAGVVGYGGVEGLGADRLVRSLVVTANRRGQGLGAAMLAAIERAAADDGAASLYMLTTTAEPFFRGRGYETARRDDAPAAIASSAEFRTLCPASATFLCKRIA